MDRNLSKQIAMPASNVDFVNKELSPKFRGGITTVITGFIIGVLNYLGVSMGLEETTSSILSIYVIGNILAYSADILFAKDTFPLKGTQKMTKISYSELGFRLKWLFRSFISSYFFRFFITIIIDTLIGITILKTLIDFFDSHDIQFWMRDSFLASFVAIFTFLLYNNSLRFDWAYADVHNPVIDMIVLMWCSLAIMIFALVYKKKNSNKEKEKEKDNEKLSVYEL